MMNKKVIAFGIIVFLLLVAGFAHAAPSVSILRTILPEFDSTYDIGSNPVRWFHIFSDNASTTALTINGLNCTGNSNGGKLTADSSGNVICSNDVSTSGSGSGTVATSTADTANQVTYFTSTNQTPATIGGDSGMTYNASADRLTVVNASTTNVSATNLWGALTGNASTATALAANGSNCSSGLFASGVDASGAAEGCTDVWTQAENTSAAYIASVTADSPLSGSGTSASHLVIANAAADGSTKGAASFTANDFNSSSGNISIDYTNGQAASGSNKGFLTSSDWTTFNGKESTLTFTWPLVRSTNTITFSGLATTSPWTVGYLAYVSDSNHVTSVATSSATIDSPLTTSGTAGYIVGGSSYHIGVQNAAADGSTKGAASFNSSDFDSSSGNISIDYTNGQASDSSHKGFLTSTDWSTFNSKVGTSRALTIAGTANQITSSAGAQDLSADRTWTLSLPSFVLFPGDFKATNATTTNATTTTQYITGITSKILKTDGSGQVIGATSGSDYAPATSGTSILKGNGSGGFSSASNGTDYTLITAKTCTGTDKLSAVTAGGTFTCSADQSGSGNGIATSTNIADTEIIYGTGVSTVGSEPAFTYDYSGNKLTVQNASTTAVTAYTAGFGGTATTTIDSTGTISAAGNVNPKTNDGAALGTSALSWSDLFLASGAVINIANGNWVATHTSGILTVGTGDLRVTTAGTNTASVVTVGGSQTLTSKVLTSATITTELSPTSDDGAPLGDTTHNFSDLFLASGAVVNFANSNYTITHSSGLLTFSGGITATAGTVTLATVAGAIDASNATSLKIPTGSSKSPTASGQIEIDTTSYQVKYGNGSATKVLGNGSFYTSFVYATSTWTGTTTIPLGPSYIGETWNGIQCFTDTGTVEVGISDGTNYMNYFNASTTVNIITLSTNNTFTAKEKRYVDIGNPASSPKKISCTVDRSYTAD